MQPYSYKNIRKLVFRYLGSTGNYFQDLGSNLIVRGGGGGGEVRKPSRKEKINKKKLTSKEKPKFRLTFFIELFVYINGSYRSNTTVNTEYLRTKNSISL